MTSTRKQKQEWAKLLYLKSTLTQREIAERVGVTEATMSKWVNDPHEKWEMLKASFVVTKEQELRRIYMQIADLNFAIESRNPGEQHATPKEADTLSKLASAARNLEKESSISDIIGVSMEIVEYLQQVDPDRAKEISALFDSFIRHKLSKL